MHFGPCDGFYQYSCVSWMRLAHVLHQAPNRLLQRGPAGPSEVAQQLLGPVKALDLVRVFVTREVLRKGLARLEPAQDLQYPVESPAAAEPQDAPVLDVFQDTCRNVEPSVVGSVDEKFCPKRRVRTSMLKTVKGGKEGKRTCGRCLEGITYLPLPQEERESGATRITLMRRSNWVSKVGAGEYFSSSLRQLLFGTAQSCTFPTYRR